jgi:hypothetical protein
VWNKKKSSLCFDLSYFRNKKSLLCCNFLKFLNKQIKVLEYAHFASLRSPRSKALFWFILILLVSRMAPSVARVGGGGCAAAAMELPPPDW